MPSDPRIARARALLSEPIARYRAAIAATIEEIRGYLAAGRSHADARADRLRDQLGPFASGRIDAGRLARILGDGGTLDAAAQTRLEAASAVLQSIAREGDGLLTVTVPPGGDPGAAVATRLAALGRAFAAARIAAAARAGAASGLDEAAALERFPFDCWNLNERRLAPPIVVNVAGADLDAGVLAKYLDGVQKILIVADGPVAPAPLVRLITPGVLVMQAHDVDALLLFAGWPGTAVAAILPAAAARFTHDPSAGREIWQRLSVAIDPAAQIARVGGLTAAQQKEELHQLSMLAARPAAPLPPAGAAAEGSGDPADRLASWLLQQAGLTPPPGA